MTTRLHGVDEPHDPDGATWEGQDETIRPPALCDSFETGDDKLTYIAPSIAPRSGKPGSAAQSESVSNVPFLLISALALFLSIAVVAIASLVGTAGVDIPGAGHAEPLRPAETRNIDLGRVAGVAFYTVEREGYRLVISVQALETGTPLRFVTTLAPEQQMTLAVPQPDGEHAVEVHFVRHGERIDVQAPGPVRPARAPTD
jgi:hypothetical protein